LKALFVGISSYLEEWLTLDEEISIFYWESWLKSHPRDEHIAFEEYVRIWTHSTLQARHFENLEERSPRGRLQGHFIIFYELLIVSNEGKNVSSVRI
jgi:hypothetical protein